MSTTTMKRIIRLESWLVRRLQRSAHEHEKSFNAEVSDALRDYAVNQMLAETPAAPDTTKEPAETTRTYLSDVQPDQLVLRYVKRLETREQAKAPCAADLHNWLKHLSTETIQGTLEWLVDRDLLTEDASGKTKRYRTKEKVNK